MWTPTPPTQLDPRVVMVPCSRCHERAFAFRLPDLPDGFLDKMRAAGGMLSIMSGGAVNSTSLALAVSALEHPAGIPAEQLRVLADGAGIVCESCLQRETDAALDAGR